MAANESIKVLLIEDEALNIKILKALLSKRFDDLTVIEAKNSKQAITIYDDNFQDIDLIICDGHLEPEGLKGPQICEILLNIQVENNKQTPIISWITDQSLLAAKLECNFKSSLFNNPITFEAIFNKFQREMFVLSKPVISKDLDVLLNQIFISEVCSTLINV